MITEEALKMKKYMRVTALVHRTPFFVVFSFKYSIATQPTGMYGIDVTGHTPRQNILANKLHSRLQNNTFPVTAADFVVKKREIEES